MEKAKKQVNHVLNGMAKQMMKADAREWPPGCMVFLYQPVRPQQKLTFNADDQAGHNSQQ